MSVHTDADAHNEMLRAIRRKKMYPYHELVTVQMTNHKMTSGHAHLPL